jgi:methanol metabolism-related c-type cytochrome
MQKITVIILSSTVALGAMMQGVLAEEIDNIAVAYSEDGRYFTNDDVPTYNIAEDGTVDWPTYEGFRRYHSECHVCHGPDGEGSSYAPALKVSAVDMDYYDFLEIVASGKMESKGGTEFVMPAFGTNRNVMCYLDDIYVYLKARGSDAIPRGRPRQKEPKSDVIRADQKECLDG